MPGDVFKKITPGTIEPGFPAGLRNGLVDLLRGSTVSTGENTPRIARNNTIIPVVNNTGGNLAQFDIVGIHSSTYDPSVEVQAAAFFHDRCMSAVTPEFDDGHVTRFGVVQEPITDGATGLCAVAGFTPIMLAVNKTWHNYAVPIDGSVDNMETAPYGSAIVHWAAGAEGGPADWALVGIKTAIPTVILGVAVTKWNKVKGDGCWVDVYPCADFLKTGQDTSNTIKVWLPRNGLDEDPNVEAGDVLTCMMLDAEQDPPQAVAISNYLDGKIDVSLRLILNGEEAQRGWDIMDAYDGKTIMFNTDTDKPVGYDWHGNTENNHDNHLATSAGRGPGSMQTLDSIDGGEYAIHTDSSNWPPYQVVKIAKRVDNSA